MSHGGAGGFTKKCFDTRNDLGFIVGMVGDVRGTIVTSGTAHRAAGASFGTAGSTAAVLPWPEA
jgi:hypothetical protein